MNRDSERVERALADFERAHAAVPPEAGGGALGAVSVATYLHLVPSEGLARLREMPPGFGVVALRQAATEGLPPAPEVAAYGRQLLSEIDGTGWGLHEFALNVWVGAPDADERLQELDILDRWRAVTWAIAWGAPGGWGDAQAWAERVAGSDEGIDRARLEILRAHPEADLPTCAALLARVEIPAIRLELLSELVRRFPEAGDAGQPWGALAKEAAERTGIETDPAQAAIRVAAVLARTGGDAQPWTQRALEAVVKTPRGERGMHFEDLLRGAALVGAAPLEKALKLLTQDISLRERLAALACVAAEALGDLRPRSDVGRALPALTAIAHKTRSAPRSLLLQALLWRAAVRSGARPPDGLRSELADRVATFEGAREEPTTLMRAARVVASDAWDVAAHMAQGISDPLTLGLWQLGRAQALIRPF